MKNMTIGTIVLLMTIMLAACAHSEGSTGTQAAAVESGTNSNAAIAGGQRQANSDFGHRDVRLFDGIEFDTIPQDIVAGQEVRFAFTIKLRDDYRDQLPALYDVIDSAQVDTYPMLLTIMSGGNSFDVEHSPIGTVVTMDESHLNNVVPDTLYTRVEYAGRVYLSTTLDEIVSGDKIKFSVSFPKPGDFGLLVNARYYCDSSRVYILNRGGINFKVR